MFQELIKEICEELNIKYTYLSKNWVIRLEKGNQVRYLTSNKFDLNGHALGMIMDDKYAFYDTLKSLNIPACEHHIFYNQDNENDFAECCHTKEDLIKCFNDYQNDVVIKPNHGAVGHGVYHITNEKRLFSKTKELFKTNYSISICPYYHAKNEYRVIVLDNQVKLIFKKYNPKVIGDGKSTLKELLVKFNPSYFTDVEVANIIPKKDEEYVYDFRFNLSRGAIASVDIDHEIKAKVTKLALEVTRKVGVTFASIDILETTDNRLLVLEANSGVTINKVIHFIPDGYNIAKAIYKEAILKMFNYTN